MRRDTGDPQPIDYESRGAQETRGIGVHELVESMRAGRPHRASGELARHVLSAADAVIQADSERRTIDLGWSAPAGR